MRSRRAESSRCSTGVRLASAVGAHGSSSRSRSNGLRTSIATSLSRALAAITSAARGSSSSAVTGLQPSRAAATDSTPLPAPQSHSAPPGSSFWSSSRLSRVDSCVPAPKVVSGSMTMSSGEPSCHGGRIVSAPTRTARRWER